MEYKVINIRNKFIFFFSLILFVGCGYFESDGIEFEETIIKNIKYSQSENTSEVNLVFKWDAHHYKIIIQDCKMIFFDSSKNIIYVESIVNEFNFNYYKVNVLDPLSGNFFEAYSKNQITKSMFDSLTSPNKLLFNKFFKGVSPN